MGVLKYFSNYLSCYHYKADVFLDVCREFTKIPKAVVSQSSSVTKQGIEARREALPIEPHLILA